MRIAGFDGGQAADAEPHYAALVTELHNCPSRQGYLVLGLCDVRPGSPLEGCDLAPGDPMFGIERCRCLRSEPLAVVTVPSATVDLRPHDLARRDLKLKLLCDL